MPNLKKLALKSTSLASEFIKSEAFVSTIMHHSSLMELDLSNSVTNEQSYVYIAEELTSVPTEHEDSENLSIEKLPFYELYQQVLDGTIRDSISVAAILKLAIMKPEIL